ncbi:MAG TPA: putative Fe-S cluster assembly protein SufT [Acidobacteriaceae bacterium]|nr:putative Fe-S cluster assembly protein SufT [Acidobacteriaceae bacterium]
MPSQITPLTRDCPATEIPSGALHVMTAGTPVFITQSLGGSFTVSTGYGQMMRIDARDADALGLPVPELPQVGNEFSEQLVWGQLKTIFDPEIPVNIVDLGLVYTCDILPVEDGHKIGITMSMTAPGCGMGDVLKADVERKLSGLPTVKEVAVQIVFDPPWNMGRMSESARLQLGLD